MSDPIPRDPTPDELDRLIARHGPERVCEALGPFISPDRIARVESVLDARLTSLTTVVEDVYDPHNAAAAIRTGEAIGLQDFHAVEPGKRFSPASGITMGCHRWIDIHRWSSVASCAASLRERGFRLYATLPDAPVDLETVDVSTPVAIVFGNEHAGLTADAVAACDGAVSIAMHGFTQSFNLSVSVALAVSRLATRRREHIAARGDLDPARRAHLRARWLGLKVRNAVGIIERHVSGGTQAGVAPDPRSRDNDGVG
jgi:tRNA (guanosine-2'-O-)-methyltransferase